MVGGPQALRGPETAALLSAAWGRQIRFESLPVAAFAERMGELFGNGDRLNSERITRDLQRVYQWYNTENPSPFTVDMAKFLARYPLALLNVKDWAMQNPIFDKEPDVGSGSKA